MIRKLDVTTYTSSQNWHHKNIATWANYHTTSAVLYEAIKGKATVSTSRATCAFEALIPKSAPKTKPYLCSRCCH